MALEERENKEEEEEEEIKEGRRIGEMGLYKRGEKKNWYSVV